MFVFIKLLATVFGILSPCGGQAHYCVPGHKKLILATVSELPRLDVGYLAVNTLASVLTIKRVWEAAGGQCKVLHPWSMEQRCTLLSL